ncbi:putative phytanoyl-CoA dioxygenase [Septoria linicola]|nr:putative phytanoyl-CoA dioxygenase [Septoria linicola]
MVTHTTDPVPDSGVDLIQHDGKSFGDWRDDFHRDGFAIVENVITPERAAYYREKQIEWLQSFNLGFDCNDESTWTQDHLHVSFKGARMEPKVQKAFTQLWGTDELLCSFDGMNITLPGQKDLSWSPWPHCDQSPHRKGMQCVQGLLNYQPNGEKDGGLIVMKGSSKLYDQFFSETREQDDHVDKPPEEGEMRDLFIFKEKDVQWVKDHGCEMVKTNLEPGDLALWDSRTMHYACFPEGDRIRHVQYICQTPAKFATKETLEKKAALFKRWHGTTHWPHCNIHEQGPPLRNGVEDPLNRYEPLEKPEVTKKLLQLAAVEAY